MIKSIIKWY